MKSHLFLLASGLTLVCGSALSQEFAGRDHVHATLLLSPFDADVRAAARSIYKRGPTSQQMLDLLSEVTWTACSGRRAMDADALSWLGKALGNSKQARYVALLDYCQAQVSDDKTKKYMKQARESLGEVAIGASVDSFEGGKLDLNQLRSRLAVKAKPSSPDQLAKRFDGVQKNQTIGDVYSLLGPPDEISASSAPGPKVGHGFVKVRTEIDALVLGYQGLGAIRFLFREGSNDWLLADATSARGYLWMAEEGRFASVNDQIANGDGSRLREIAGSLIERGSLGRDLLDRIAGRIHRSRLESDDELADGLAWLCKVIAKSQDGRYRQFMVDVSNTAANEKLRKYAGKTANGLPENAGEQFVAVSN